MNTYKQLYQLVATGALILLPSVAQANPVQSSSQSVSGSTMATGNGATAVSQTQQSVYQTGGSGAAYSQTVIQGTGVDTVAIGDGAAAETQIHQSAIQSLGSSDFESWSDMQTQIILQQAGVNTQALEDWSTSVNQVNQTAEQYAE